MANAVQQTAITIIVHEKEKNVFNHAVQMRLFITAHVPFFTVGYFQHKLSWPMVIKLM